MENPRAQFLVRIAVVSLVITVPLWLAAQVFVFKSFFPPIGIVGALAAAGCAVFIRQNRKWSAVPSVIWGLFYIITEYNMMAMHISEPFTLDSIIAWVTLPFGIVAFLVSVLILVNNLKNNVTSL